MHSCTGINGQYQHVGPAPQGLTQLIYDTTRNQLAASANNSCQYSTVNMGVQQQQSSNFMRQKQTKWQTSQSPQQTASFSHPAGGNNNNHYAQFFQDSTANTQMGNPSLQFSKGFQTTTKQQCFDPTSAPNSPTQMPPGMTGADTMCFQQDMSLCGTQPVIAKQSIRVHNSNVVSDLQNYSVQKNVHQKVNSVTMKPVYTHATSVLRGQQVCTSSLVSGNAHERQTVYNQYPRQHETQQRLSSSSSPNNIAAALQCYSNNNNDNNKINRQFFDNPSMSQRTQQYAHQPYRIHSKKQQATSTGNSQFNRFSSKVDEMPSNYNTEIARIVDDLEKIGTAHSDDRRPLNASSPYVTQQLVSEERIKESYQPAQPGTSPVRQDTTQLPYSETIYNFMSGPQHFQNTSPQQSSATYGSRVTTTVDRSGNGNEADSALSKRSRARLLHHVPLLKRMLESDLPQETTKQSPVANSHERLENLKTSDGSFYTSPGRTGTRVVAVVQPLSQESNQVASTELGECTTTHASLSIPAKLTISPDVEKIQKGDFNVSTENDNQNQTNHSAVSGDGSSSTSSGTQDLLLQQLCAEKTGLEMAINMQADKGIATTAHRSSEVPVIQNGEMITEQKLSLIPTTPWTVVMLNNLIKEEKKILMQEEFRRFDSANTLLRKIWDDNSKLLSQDWYRDLITAVKRFCYEHVTIDCTILTQVKNDVEEILKQYHVLQDEEIYSEPLYKSSWFNVNEQLDDIDKEFGFPSSLKHRLNTCKTDNQPEQDETVNSDPAQIVGKERNDVSSRAEIESVVSGEEKQASTLVTTSSKTLTTNKIEAADSGDPHYSFEIQVLPPEEAKVIFELVQSKMPQSKNVDSLPEEAISSVEGDLCEAMDVTPLKQVCCISRWIEIVGGSSGSKCQCNKEQSHIDCLDTIPDVEETAAQNNYKQCSRKSDAKLHSAIREDKVNGDNDIMTSSRPDICSELSHTIPLSDDDDIKPTHLFFDKENNISQMNLNDSQSSDYKNEETKTAEISLSKHSDNCKKEVEKVSSSEVPSQMSEDDCAQAELTSTDVTHTSLESHEEKTPASVTPALQKTFKLNAKCGIVERKRKTLSSDNIIFSKMKSKKCKFSVDTESQPVFKSVNSKEASSATNGKTVELALFGTAQQGECALNGSRKSHISSPKSRYIAALVPPRILSVNVGPLNVPAKPYSVKHQIYEKWRSSFLPTKVRQRGKLQTTLSLYLKKDKTACPTNITELPLSSERRICNKNTKRSLSLKKLRSQSRGENKMNREVVALKLPADEERSDAGSGSCAITALQENNGLKIKFKFGSSERKETTQPVSGRSYY